MWVGLSKYLISHKSCLMPRRQTIYPRSVGQGGMGQVRHFPSGTKWIRPPAVDLSDPPAQQDRS
jgi:hypothetical protein